MMRRTGKSLSSHAPSQRQLRVGEALRHALAEILARGKLRDPALAGTSITVTEVQVSADLRRATIYVTPLGGEKQDLVLEGLGRASSYLRSEVARLMSLRFSPEFVFEADTSFDRASRIDDLLRGSAGGPDAEH